ncbi:hypothetical protein E2C01_068489 [Portunus trituberculatus]|uniref:Uncharacterized protein n=1 Tax=Portunus trituberculatus TaxID=210409 RepID=A0A5B7HNZ0_PORTR|nr:hypothetical protein [Portunus trituberculatus]
MKKQSQQLRQEELEGINEEWCVHTEEKHRKAPISAIQFKKEAEKADTPVRAVTLCAQSRRLELALPFCALLHLPTMRRTTVGTVGRRFLPRGPVMSRRSQQSSTARCLGRLTRANSCCWQTSTGGTMGERALHLVSCLGVRP